MLSPREIEQHRIYAEQGFSNSRSIESLENNELDGFICRNAWHDICKVSDTDYITITDAETKHHSSFDEAWNYSLRFNLPDDEPRFFTFTDDKDE